MDQKKCFAKSKDMSLPLILIKTFFLRLISQSFLVVAGACVSNTVLPMQTDQFVFQYGSMRLQVCADTLHLPNNACM